MISSSRCLFGRDSVRPVILLGKGQEKQMTINVPIHNPAKMLLSKCVIVG